MAFTECADTPSSILSSSLDMIAKTPVGNEGSDSVEGQLRQHISGGRLVLFVGNGVRRVPTSVINSAGRPISAENDVGPSWQRYMEKLWESAQLVHEIRDDDLDFSSFSRLTAPRQAEWFDRRTADLLSVTPSLAATLRMHLLGRDLHPLPGIPFNLLLKTLAEITLDSSRDGLDLITTNVDCAIEQNIAWASDQRLLAGESKAPQLIIKTAQGHTATWQRIGTPIRSEIRIWKIHGCLSAIKSKLPRKTWSKTEKRWAERVFPKEGQDYHSEFAGAVPTSVLWPGSQWHNDDVIHRGKTPPAVFSVTEYTSLLTRLLTGRSPSLFDLFSCHPILFLGYDLHEVDVDIVVTLQRSRSKGPPRYALRFRADEHSDSHEEERLRQMGVHWWPFRLAPLARAPLPGELRLTTRHEWRYGRKVPSNTRELKADLTNPWRKELQNVASQAWLEAQEVPLRVLAASSFPLPAPENSIAGSRLVIAGLASMWHAFALKASADMPSRRRVSANLAAVDSEVPGGSGLVPAMVAAAAAGPDTVGRITFLTNIGRQWSQWEEIEEFCLSGGIDVRPLEGKLGKNAGARTSHVLLYDPHGQEGQSARPRQRMIMDVDELVDPNQGGSIANAVAPSVKPVPGLGNSDHLLFGDKLVSSELLAEWQGPVVFETGSSGDELLDQIVAPTFWTAGFGSFIRTLVCARLGSKNLGGHWQANLRQDNLEKAVGLLREEPDLSFLVDRGAPGDMVAGEYVALINSFGRDLWPDKGVTHSQELTYGCWLQKQWHALGDVVWRIVDQPSSGRPLVASRGPIGRGILTTLHEAGLMAHLDLPNHGKCSVVVRIETDTSETTLRLICEAPNPSTSLYIPDPIIFKLPPLQEQSSESKGLAIIPGAEAIEIPVAERLRRHTLGAGDTVRGCLAYGLWAWAFEKKQELRPGSVEHVILASCFLATLKSYAGSFVEFLRVIDGLRPTPAWRRLWGFPD